VRLPSFSSINNAIVWRIVDLWQRIHEPVLLGAARFVSNRSNEPTAVDDLVSVIVATYNRSTILIERTLPSILSQTHKNLEVVVVGDCCVDDTPVKIKEVKDSRVRFFDLKKRGIYPTDIEQRWFVQGSVPRNFGMKVARGRWFVFISDDDVLYPEHLETLLTRAKQLGVEFVSAGYDAVRDGKVVQVMPEKNNYASELVCGGMQTWMYRSYLKCFRWNRNSWRKPFDRPVDYDLQQRFYRSGVKMGHTNDVVFFNPPVEGTNTIGYKAAILAERAWVKTNAHSS
jgi:glycosyltransferase involved in cell wall biosynthesis